MPTIVGTLSVDSLNGQVLFDLLVSYENLPAADKVGHWGRLVGSPLLDILLAVDENDEIFFFAFVVDFNLISVPTSHVDGRR